MASIMSPLDSRGSIGYPVGSPMVRTSRIPYFAAQQAPPIDN